MKKIVFTKQKGIVLLVSSVFTTALFFLSCNKNDITFEQLTKQTASAIANAKSLISKNGTQITVSVNEKLGIFLSDKNGNEISEEKLSNPQNLITSACNYSNYDASATLISYTLATLCTSGTPNPSTKIIWHYQVSNNNNIVATNPTNTNFKTKGLLRIYASNGTLSYTADITNVTITDLGLDASNSGYELFDVGFTSDLISNSAYFNPQFNYTMKLGATMATNCPDIEQFNIGIQPYTPPNYQNGSYNPCSRTDQGYINQNTGSSRSLSIVGGYVSYSCLASGFVQPDVQEVRYSTDGGKTWSENGMTYHGNSSGLWQNFNNIPNKGYVDPSAGSSNTMILTHGVTYNLKFQERNIKYNKSYGSSPFPLPTATNSCSSAWGEMPTAYNNYNFTF